MRCRDQVLASFERVDILINNAGVYLDKPSHVQAALDNTVLPHEELAELLVATMDVNVIGVMRTIDAFVPSMRGAHYGRIVNVSSGMARYVELAGNAVCYRTSKAALNTLSRVLALREAPFNIKINAVCPGWIQTDMGGPHALRSAEQGTYGVLYAAALSDDGPTGQLLRDGECFGW
jgi:NAD(P)-dependent dehydrogenase (short-subunit alcohol dehydrogenase family)